MELIEFILWSRFKVDACHCWLVFQKKLNNMTSFILLDTPTLNHDHEMEVIFVLIGRSISCNNTTCLDLQLQVCLVLCVHFVNTFNRSRVDQSG
jgi:hypothetical protein